MMNKRVKPCITKGIVFGGLLFGPSRRRHLMNLGNDTKATQNPGKRPGCRVRMGLIFLQFLITATRSAPVYNATDHSKFISPLLVPSVIGFPNQATTHEVTLTATEFEHDFGLLTTSGEVRRSSLCCLFLSAGTAYLALWL